MTRVILLRRWKDPISGKIPARLAKSFHFKLIEEHAIVEQTATSFASASEVHQGKITKLARGGWKDQATITV